MDSQLNRRAFIGSSAAVLAVGLLAPRVPVSQPKYELLVGCYNANTGEETFTWKERDLQDFRRLTNPGRITYPNGEMRIGRCAFEMIEPADNLPPEYIKFRKGCTSLDQAFNEEISKVLS